MEHEHAAGGWGRRGAAAVVLTLIALGVSAEQRPSGSEYWFAWPRTPDVTGNDPTYDLDAELIVLTDSSTPVPFTVDGPSFNVSGNAVSGAPGRVRIPRSLMMATNGVVESKGLHLHADACGQLAALFRVPGSGSSVGDDVLTLLPATILGTEYWPDTYHGRAELAVVATEDGTRVQWDNPHCPGPVDVLLDRGESIEHLCDDDVGAVLQRGIDGTHVVTDKPVALIAGSAASNIVHYLIPSFPTPVEIIWCCADVLLEQLRPTSDWEREAFTVPFLQAGPVQPGDVIRVMAACDPTDVVVDDGLAQRTRTLAPGDVWELTEADLPNRTFRLANRPLRISASRPIQVNQYSIGWQMTAEGDPSQAVVPGLLRPTGLHVFFVPEESQGHANVVGPVSAIGIAALDGVAIPAASWTTYPDGLHAFARVGPLLPGEHRIDGPGPLSVLVYGFSVDDAGAIEAGQYAYPAPSFGPNGTFPALVQPDDLCSSRCPGDCVTLDAGPAYVAYDWSTGDASQAVVACPATDAIVTVAVVDANGCDGLGVIDLPVLPGATPVIAGELVACEGECPQLSVAPGFSTVAWSTGDAGDATIVCPTQPLTSVDVIVTNADGCEGRDQVEVVLLRAPVLAAAGAADLSRCGSGVELSWPPAAWLNDPATGSYSVYRSESGCAAALASAPLVTGLRATTWRDPTTQPGPVYAYVVLAEDDAVATRCGNGPDHGGLTATACVTGVVDEVDRTPPAQDALATLRGDGHAGTSIRFRWDAAPALDAAAGEHFHFHRSASVFGPFVRLSAEGFTGRGFTDPDGAAAPLLFYDLRIADSCENATEDPFPPTACHGNACQQPSLAQGHPFSWDTCSPGCGSAFASHACAPIVADGVDRVHRFETLADGPLRVTLRSDVASLDVLLYDDALATCLAWGDAELSLASLPAGRYALVVDGPAASEGGYALTWEATP